MVTKEQLKRWRVPTGLTQRAAAMAADVSPWRLAAAELGELRLSDNELESLKSTYLEKIAENLEMVMGDLLRQPDLVGEMIGNDSADDCNRRDVQNALKIANSWKPILHLQGK